MYDFLDPRWASAYEQFSNQLQLHLIAPLVNFPCELGQIMTRVAVTYVQADSNLT